ncbi:PecA family PE domain-processing aspartic protease [Mycobacterium sp. WMMD1722]|uniref:PecA family PE domain-processing aspartic protease n=1 Tax=Mycobacterium sp. WMMD1722 TaxID=3404117 RepID=UPI003BF5A810
MKMRLWAGSVLAGSAIATGACLYCAASAHAAPGEDGGGVTSASTSASSVQRDSAPARSSSAGDRPAGVTARHAAQASPVERPGRRSAAVSVSADPDRDEVARPSRPSDARTALRGGVSMRQDAPSSGDDDAHPPSHAAATVAARSTDSPDDRAETAAETEAEMMPADPVGLALQQLSEAQNLLFRQTWGRGDVFAGVASVAPQVLIAQAQWSLNHWRTTNSQHQSLYADTEGVPIAHDLAGLALGLNNSLPSVAQDAIEQAAALVPGLRQFGAGEELSEVVDLLGDARRNGLVYSAIPVQLNTNGNSVATEPTIYISVNGGGRVPVLVDTGSFGLIIDPRYVGPEGLGEPIDSGTSGYGGGGFTYDYDVYVTTVDFGDGIVSAPTPVGIVSTRSVDGFADYNKNGGYVGILGIGPDAGGPLKTSPVNALPGLLGRGLFLDEENELLVLGANPLPERASVQGTRPDLLLRVGGLPAEVTPSVIDSGGILGNFPESLDAVDGLENLPAGTEISVYTEDGETLLYTYRTTEVNTPNLDPPSDDGAFNTGFTPFALGPVYIDFTSLYSRTVFDYPRVGSGSRDLDEDVPVPAITRW